MISNSPERGDRFSDRQENIWTRVGYPADPIECLLPLQLNSQHSKCRAVGPEVGNTRTCSLFIDNESSVLASCLVGNLALVHLVFSNFLDLNVSNVAAFGGSHDNLLWKGTYLGERVRTGSVNMHISGPYTAKHYRGGGKLTFQDLYVYIFILYKFFSIYRRFSVQNCEKVKK